MNKIILDVQAGVLPVRVGPINRQQYAEDIASRLIVKFPADGSTFGIGSVVPTSNEGPYFESISPDDINGIGQNNGYQLLSWSSSSGSYNPLILSQQQLKYSLSITEPDHTKYLLWFQVDADNKLEGIFTWNRLNSEWENVIATDYFESFGDDGKGQVAWGNVTLKPNYIQTGVSSGDSGINIVPEFDYQRIWHTGISGEIIYNPVFGGWQTVGGVAGDLKFVTADNLGSPGDFNAGLFVTALGRNPGWAEAWDEKGRVIVAADNTEPWSSLTSAVKQSGSLFGQASVKLTGQQSGLPEHNHEIYGSFNTGTFTEGDGFLKNSHVAIGGEITNDNGFGRVNANGTPLILWEGNIDAVSDHNNIQPSIARFLLRKL